LAAKVEGAIGDDEAEANRQKKYKSLTSGASLVIANGVPLVRQHKEQARHSTLPASVTAPHRAATTQASKQPMEAPCAILARRDVQSMSDATVAAWVPARRSRRVRTW